nr:transposase [bacterium]
CPTRFFIWQHYTLKLYGIRTANKLSSMHQALSLIKRRFEDNYHNETTTIKIVDHCLSVVEDSIGQIRKQAQAEDEELLKLLCSLPGVGKITANALIAEIGNIERFKNSKSLIAYAGLDPRVRQSGKLLHHNTRLTKRGSPYLRKVLFTAASIGLRHDKELGDYYTKKRNEGRSYKEAVIATARKLTNRAYAVWRERRVYVKTQT